MKFQDLIDRLLEEGCVFVRHGGSHDIYPTDYEVQRNGARLSARTPSLESILRVQPLSRSRLRFVRSERL